MATAGEHNTGCGEEGDMPDCTAVGNDQNGGTKEDLAPKINTKLDYPNLKLGLGLKQGLDLNQGEVQGNNAQHPTTVSTALMLSISMPTQSDVLIGTDPNYASHPGNLALRGLLISSTSPYSEYCRERYEATRDKRMARNQFFKEVTNYYTLQTGGRFLKRSCHIMASIKKGVNACRRCTRTCPNRGCTNLDTANRKLKPSKQCVCDCGFVPAPDSEIFQRLRIVLRRTPPTKGQNGDGGDASDGPKGAVADKGELKSASHKRSNSNLEASPAPASDAKNESEFTKSIVEVFSRPDPQRDQQPVSVPNGGDAVATSQSVAMASRRQSGGMVRNQVSLQEFLHLRDISTKTMAPQVTPDEATNEFEAGLTPELPLTDSPGRSAPPPQEAFPFHQQMPSPTPNTQANHNHERIWAKAISMASDTNEGDPNDHQKMPMKDSTTPGKNPAKGGMDNVDGMFANPIEHETKSNSSALPSAGAGAEPQFSPKTRKAAQLYNKPTPSSRGDPGVARAETMPGRAGRSHRGGARVPNRALKRNEDANPTVAIASSLMAGATTANLGTNIINNHFNYINGISSTNVGGVGTDDGPTDAEGVSNTKKLIIELQRQNSALAKYIERQRQQSQFLQSQFLMSQQQQQLNFLVRSAACQSLMKQDPSRSQQQQPQMDLSKGYSAQLSAESEISLDLPKQCMTQSQREIFLRMAALQPNSPLKNTLAQISASNCQRSSFTQPQAASSMSNQRHESALPGMSRNGFTTDGQATPPRKRRKGTNTTMKPVLACTVTGQPVWIDPASLPRDLIASMICEDDNDTDSSSEMQASSPTVPAADSERSAILTVAPAAPTADAAILGLSANVSHRELEALLAKNPASTLTLQRKLALSRKEFLQDAPSANMNPFMSAVAVAAAAASTPESAAMNSDSGTPPPAADSKRGATPQNSKLAPVPCVAKSDNAHRTISDDSVRSDSSVLREHVITATSVGSHDVLLTSKNRKRPHRTTAAGDGSSSLLSKKAYAREMARRLLESDF